MTPVPLVRTRVAKLVHAVKFVVAWTGVGEVLGPDRKKAALFVGGVSEVITGASVAFNCKSKAMLVLVTDARWTSAAMTLAPSTNSRGLTEKLCHVSRSALVIAAGAGVL